MHLVPEPQDQLVHLVRSRVTHGVGDVERHRTGPHHFRKQFHQELRLATGRVFRTELHIVCEALSVFHRRDRRLEHLLRLHLELELHVQRTGCEKGVDAPVFRVLQRLNPTVDVADRRTAQGHYGRPLALLANGLHTFKITGRTGSKSRLNDIHA